jgi:hypothetical protein
MLWVSREERWRKNSPRQRFHSQPCCKIVRYFSRTLYVPIIRRNKCINATPGICHSVDDRLVCRMGWNPILHTRRSSTQSDKYQVSHWYTYFSWWWAHSCPKHVENRNKHTRKIVHQVGFIYKMTMCVSSFFNQQFSKNCRCRWITSKLIYEWPLSEMLVFCERERWPAT